MKNDMATAWTALDRMRGGQGTAEDMRTLVNALDELSAYRADSVPSSLIMRVAEAVREACAEQAMRTVVFDAIDVVRPGWHEQKATAAHIVRDLDLAAVVAKAVKP